MNRLEEIQEIIKNFIYEKQQMKQEITNIENKRTQLAAERNEKKSNMKYNDAYTKEVEAEINMLGKEITELGNQSQELQNRLDSKYISIKNEVNMQIDNLISEEIRKIRKITEAKEEIEQKIIEQENRNSKYEIQKQEFFNRFGRMPELSETAQKENDIQEQEYNSNKQKVLEIELKIDEAQEELSILAKNKKEFKNKNYSYIICCEIEEQQEIPNIPEEVQIELQKEEALDSTEFSEDNLEQIVNLVENIIEEQRIEENIVECEEETIILPLIEENDNLNDETHQILEKEQIIQLEEFEPIMQEIQIEEIEPICELKIEEFEPEELKIEEFKPISEISIEEFLDIPEINIEEIEPIAKIEEIEESESIEKIQEIEIQEEIINNKIEQVQEIEEEIITAEETDKNEETIEIPIFGGRVTLLNITAKFENDKVVYNAHMSNGKTIKIYPTEVEEENIILKDKENREELKEVLINYAISEYRTFDKKVIKKIDPIICEILVKFSKEYNYDAQNLIYNYAMSFSKSDEIETDTIPQITYNFSYIEHTNLSKREKEILLNICKNARKNDRVEIIGYNTGINKIKYIFKRTFNLNNRNALPEGKY